MKTLLFCLSAFLLFPNGVSAQKKEKAESLKLKFGDINAELFSEKHPLFDSISNAIILTDIGKSYIEGNNNGWFSMVYYRHQRIKVVNTNGMDAANFSIPLYGEGADKDRIVNLKASAFNFQNGQVIESKLDEKHIFEDRLDKNWSISKFAVPQVKEGSIIEVTYQVKSNYLRNLRSWEFQGADYPRLWSEYTVELPDFLQYVAGSQGYLPFFEKSVTNSFKQFIVTRRDEYSNAALKNISLSSNVVVAKWAVKNAPVLKNEPFVLSLKNHVTKLSFQLAAYRFPNRPEEKVMPNWDTAALELDRNPFFGEYLVSDIVGIAGTTRDLTDNLSDSLQKALRIYEFIQEKFVNTGNTGFYTNASARQVFKEKKGSVAEINLLMVLMLRQAGLDASPVLISTQSNGLPNPDYPLLSKYDYVVTLLKVNGNNIFLDATVPLLGFGHLFPEAYNGIGFVVSNKAAQSIALTPDSVTEKKETNISVQNLEGNNWGGTVSILHGNFNSFNIRTEIAKNGTDAYFSKITKQYSDETQLSDLKVDSLKKYSFPIKVNYKINLNGLKEADIIYFNPLVGLNELDNPLKSPEREYPVEFGSKLNQVVNVTLNVPNGYVIDELPKATRFKLENGDGIFEYLIENQSPVILIRTRLVINKTTFAPEEYETLRSFFTMMITKQQEQIVFKKSN